MFDKTSCVDYELVSIIEGISFEVGPKSEVQIYRKSPLCSTGHWPFGAAAHKEEVNKKEK